MLGLMTDKAARRHVVVLAPMPLELDAVVQAFGLQRTGEDLADPWIGRVGQSEVTALHTGMGPPVTRATASALFDTPRQGMARPDHVMNVGICGGLRRDVEVGTVLNPEVIVEHSSGATYNHHPPGTEPRAGKLATMEAVTLDSDLSRRLLEDGFLGVDMESSAVAEVCEAYGCDWSIYRCIGDRHFDGLLSDKVVATANPDGSPNVEAVKRLLAEHPELLPKLEQLARDSAMAARRAAEAAVRGCLALDELR